MNIEWVCAMENKNGFREYSVKYKSGMYRTYIDLPKRVLKWMKSAAEIKNEIEDPILGKLTYYFERV